MTARQTDGARELRAFLSATKQSITGFCLAQKLDRIQVARALKGQLSRYSVDFAYSIERATRGRVKVHLWRSETARRKAA